MIQLNKPPIMQTRLQTDLSMNDVPLFWLDAVQTASYTVKYLIPSYY